MVQRLASLEIKSLVADMRMYAEFAAEGERERGDA